MGTESATVGLGCLLDNNVADNELVDIETVNLGVGLGVLEQAKEELGRLDGPATLHDTVLLGLGGTTDGTVVATEGDALPVGLDVLKVDKSLRELEATESSGGLTVTCRVSNVRHTCTKPSAKLTECSCSGHEGRYPSRFRRPCGP